MTQQESMSVFISYARADANAFAEELMLGLEVAGFQAYLDKHDIAAGEEWEARLESLIEAADTVVFVITPASAKSPRCSWEVDKAEELSKRVIPVVLANVPEADLPDRLKQRNFIFFTEGQSYAKSLSELAHALRVDLTWIREHSRLATLATRWDARDRNESLLLRGQDLASALAWLSAWRAPAPEPTLLQRDLLARSDEAEQRLHSVERKRARRAIATLVMVVIVFAGLAVASTVLWLRANVNEQRFEIAANEALILANEAVMLKDIAEKERQAAQLAEMSVRNTAAQALWFEGMYWLQVAMRSPPNERTQLQNRAQQAFTAGLETISQVPDDQRSEYEGEALKDLLDYGRAMAVSCQGSSVSVDMGRQQLMRIRGFFDSVRMEGCSL
ncbi:MAG: toll/interleukin-1 receptor domain-containing protein [Hyphomonas sp.]